MGDCPHKGCSWSGSHKAFMKHYANKHFKSKAKKQGKVKVFKKPGFTKRKK